MANKLTTQLILGPYNHVYFRYMMDKPEDLLDEKHPCHLKSEEPLFIDVETHNKDYSNIRLIQIYQEGWPQVIEFDTNETSVREVYDVIKDMHVVSHMSTMEISCFQNDLKPDGVEWCDYKPGNPFEQFSDTFLLARRALYNKIDGFSLDKVAAHIHGVDYYKDYATTLGLTQAQIDGYKKYMQKSFLDTPKSDKRNTPLVEEQLIYGALDVLVMPKIYEELKYTEQEFIVKLDYMFINHCTRYQHIGLPLMLGHWEEHKETQDGLIQEAIDFMPHKFNFRSYKQVRALLRSNESDDAYLAQVMDGTDMLDNGEEACQWYADDPSHFAYRQNCAEYIRQYRSAIKRVEYLTAYKKQYNKFGVVKGYISPRTISGRLAGDEINMLNIPRSLKDLFGFKPGSGYCLCYSDYSQLELRMTAAVLNEHAMIEKFMNDEDIHVYAASEVYDKAPAVITKAERFIGKFFNFSACVTGDMKVDTIEGKIPLRDVKVGDMVYCMDPKTLEYDVKPVTAVHNSGVKETIRVHWRSATGRVGSLECTPDHVLYDINGRWVRADDSVGKSLSFLNHTIKKEGPMKEPTRWLYGSRNYYEAAHRLIGKRLLGASEGQDIHHVNHDRLDNRVVNLKVLTRSEHMKHHAVCNYESKKDALIAGARACTGVDRWNYKDVSPFTFLRDFSKAGGKQIKMTIGSKDFVQDRASSFGMNLKEAGKRYNTQGKYISRGTWNTVMDKVQPKRTRCRMLGISPNGSKYDSLMDYYTEGSFNHKVTHIERVGKQQTYDITVKDHHNFIAEELVVHNSYGAGSTRLCTMLLKEAGVYMSEEEMRPLHQRWKRTWPQITNWHRVNGRSRTNEDTTLLGRHYKAKMYTDLNAIKMQGSSAEVFKLAHLYMIKNMPDIAIGAAVHDSFITILEDDPLRFKQTSFVVAWSKLTAWFEVIKNAACPTLKMPIEVLIGYNWGGIDNEGKYIYSYKIEGTYEQYMEMKNIVTSGNLLQKLDTL